MVGVPRSTGCRLCVKRRVRCDEARPKCTNCVRYGVECPGYDKAFKFVAEKHARRHGARMPSAGTETTGSFMTWSSQEKSVAKTSSSSFTDMASAMAFPRFEFAQWLQGGRMHILLPLTQILYDRSFNVEFVQFKDWFSGIPAFLGNKIALDSAVAAMALLIQGTVHEDAMAMAQARDVYGKALGELQRALRHPTEWKSSETLCTAMLLCLFESFVGTSSNVSWMAHAGGAAQLIQLRGPQAHESEWEASMLRVFRGLAITRAMFAREDCFLAEDEWREVSRQKIANPPGRIIDDVWSPLALVPSLLRRVYALRAQHQSGSLDRTAAKDLYKDSNDVRQQLLDWNTRIYKFFPPPREVPSQDPLCPFPTIFAFQSLWLGSLFMIFWSNLLVVNRIISECDPSTNYTRENRELVVKILKTVEGTSKGIMGPFRVGFSVRVVSDFLEGDEAAWIEGLVTTWAESFAAVSPSVKALTAPVWPADKTRRIETMPEGGESTGESRHETMP